MSKANTPPRDLKTPHTNPNLPAQRSEDSNSETDNPDPWSDEYFPQNIQPFDTDDENADAEVTPNTEDEANTGNSDEEEEEEEEVEENEEW